MFFPRMLKICRNRFLFHTPRVQLGKEHPGHIAGATP